MVTTAQTQRAVSRYGYGYRVTTSSHEEFLADVAALCLADAYGYAAEHDDDPTETLYPFELDAAKAGVALPDYYFKRRAGWLEHEAEQAVAEYVEAEAGER
jgi:hypothetical protein